MIPRLKAREDGYYRGRERGPLFASERTLRPLSVMIDAQLLNESEEFSYSTLLTAFLTHELIVLNRYSDDGPPPGSSEKSHGRGRAGVPGWVKVVEVPDAGMLTHQVITCTEDSIRSSAIHGGDFLNLAKQGHDVAAEKRATGATQRYRDAVAGLASEAIGADIFITERDYLFEVTWSLLRDVTVMRPQEALSFVSLYLRTQGQFIVWMGQSGGTYRFNKGLFYWVGARELLPGGWRWFSACVQSDQGSEASTMTLLGQSALQRVDRALALRDEVHRAMNQPQNNDVADDALQAFDSCLLFLMGSLDAAARVAHAALSLRSSPYQAGWQQKQFRRDVNSACPDLGALVEDGSRGRHLLNVLVPLRNTVHSAGLTSIAIMTSVRRRERTLVDLSSGMDTATRQKFEVALTSLGGDESWGVDRTLGDRILADPGVMVDRLVGEVCLLLNDLMEATPVERLPGVDASALERTPPADDHDPFNETNRQSIRWQLGF